MTEVLEVALGMTAVTGTLRLGPVVGAERKGIEAPRPTSRTCMIATVPVRAVAVTRVQEATRPAAADCQQW
jgi:hypothetical protein